MPFLNLSGFSGVFPRTGPTNLAPNQAQIARNVKLQSGELRPWREPLAVYTPANNNVKTIYRFKGPDNLDPIWLTWTNDVDVVAGPVADTTDYRLYYTGTGMTPRKTNWNLATGNGLGVAPFPNAYYEMGVPAPTGAPTVTAAGTCTAPTEPRAYVYTYVTTFGTVFEESAPSPAGTVTCNTSGDSVTVTGFTAPPTGNYNFTHRRIYRSVTGSSSTNYQLVAQITIATTTYVDTKSVTELGVVLPSLYFTPPPSGLQGLVSMPNGILAGFVGNQIWFCEPYLPHAWPSNYMLTTEFPIVGLGVFGNSLFVGTTKNPYLVTGTFPGSMMQEKMSILQPCISKKSIVSDQFGLVYASPNGLVSIGPGTQDVVTTGLFTRDEWTALAPETMIGAIYNNMYIGFYKTDGVTKTLVIVRNDNPPLITLDADASAVFIEHTSGSVFIVSESDNKIYKLDADPLNNKLFEWKSKKFVLPRPMNFAAMKVQADFDYMDDDDAYQTARALVLASNAALFPNDLAGEVDDTPLNQYDVNGSKLAYVPSEVDNRFVNVIVYADGVQVFNANITDQEPIRMPGGFKAYVWEILFTGNVPVRAFHMATSMTELRTQPNG